jgi:hypothetical protein
MVKTKRVLTKSKMEFRIASIKKQSYFQNEYSKFGLGILDIKKGFVKVKTNIQIDNKNGIASILLNIVFGTNKQKKHFELFGIETVHNFQIRNFAKIFSGTKKEPFEIPDELMVMFLNISISDTRGMLVALNTNQDYTNIILPIINPKNLLEEIKKRPKRKS